MSSQVHLYGVVYGQKHDLAIAISQHAVLCIKILHQRAEE